MKLNLLNRKFKISVFSVVIFAFFLIVSIVSLHVVREKILENSHIMGQAIAARFATKETTKIKAQEMLLRSVAKSMSYVMNNNQNLTDAQIEQSLRHFTEYMESNAEITRFELYLVIDGRLVGSHFSDDDVDVNTLKWYKAALNNNGDVVYSNLYKHGSNNESVLTMAIRLDNSNHVLAMNLYPERLNELLADNELPQSSYYYLCDPNGNIMFTINDRAMSLEDQQPYVDRIFNEIREGGGSDVVNYIIDLEGNKRGVYYAVSDKGWISIVTIPYNYLLGDYKSLLQWFIITLIIFILLAIMWGLREHNLNKQVNRINEVIQVMSKSFLAVFRVNLASGRYHLLKSDQLGFEPAQNGFYEELLKQLVEHVEPDAAEEFARTFSLENVKTFAERNVYDFGGDFRQVVDDNYHWVNVRLVRDDEFLAHDEAIFFFREIDAEKLKELEHLQVTERALEMARENAKSRNMFFSAMSHDMRAPLNGIIGMAELASMHKDNKDLVSGYVQKIKSSGKQLLTLINDILDMARLDNGKIEHSQENFSLAEMANEVADIYKAQAELENKFFDVQISLDNEIVCGDAKSLHHILNNILSNALKYTEAQGKISFIVRRENLHNNEGQYTFIVKDTGCGMSEKFLEKIYEPFERDSRFGVPKVVGTGLGMTIVKALVERLEGNIHITSHVDEGTCVIISLPFTVVDKQSEKKDRPVSKLNDFAGCKILVAEDNDINMEIISELLKMNGLEVIPAANGKIAVEKFQASEVGSIKMILMDMQMPEMDGCEASRAIRKLDREDADSVAILALTGNSGSEDVEAAMQAGMNNYMVKPVKMKLLARMMSEYIHR